MKYKVEIIVDAGDKQWSYKVFNDLGLEVENVSLYKNTRTLQQNKALHKMFQETKEKPFWGTPNTWSSTEFVISTQQCQILKNIQHRRLSGFLHEKYY